ncbi:MAG: IgGFc-binding protein [Proteobacteria bacterium]|nr:IgGFc-binding protein [Pseudomonadota bacterium]
MKKLGYMALLLLVLTWGLGCEKEDSSLTRNGTPLPSDPTDTENNFNSDDTNRPTPLPTDGKDSDSTPLDIDTEAVPLTCAQAAENRSYIGCDFWPTVTYNMVWYNQAAQEGFEFAVVVANDGIEDAHIQITGGALGQPLNETIPKGSLKAIVLPWVQTLKGTTFINANTSGHRVETSVLAQGGAYHMTSSIPVTAWQFSPLEYELSPMPAGCIDGATTPGRCYSVTNDASMLIPTTAMTGNYRVFSYGGSFPDTFGDAPGAIAITATENNTLVHVQLTADIAAGTGVTAASAGETISYTLNAGDVLQLLGAPGQWMGEPHSDLTGSVVMAVDANNPGTADQPNFKPVQVIGLSPIVDLTPATEESYADHIEELVLPAEVIGNNYVVTAPTGPSGNPVRHLVRFIGSVAGTQLTYAGTTPAGAPTALSPGQVVDIETLESFQVSSQDEDHPFVVVSYIVGAEPSVSMAVAPEQFRKQYTFLAPTTYESNYADILVPQGANATLDGAPLAGSATPINGTEWSIHRIKLDNGPRGDGMHKLEANQPVGLQVMGYGWATSYYYPGGLNLKLISKTIIITID